MKRSVRIVKQGHLEVVIPSTRDGWSANIGNRGQLSAEIQRRPVGATGVCYRTS